MNNSRYLLTVITFGWLAGCGLETNNDAESEHVATVQQAVIYLNGTVYNTGGEPINVRLEPNTTSRIVGSVTEGMSLGISCQTNGHSVLGTTIWNYVPAYNGYVTDAYVYTGYDSFVPGMPMCGPSTPPFTSTGLDTAIVVEARTHKGYEADAGDCNKFSRALGGDPCHAWCGDFVRYVWQQAGAKTDRLSGYSGSFRDYGRANGTWKDITATPKVGDAVVWGDSSYQAHVAIIAEVSGSRFKIVHGNYDNDGDGRGEVYETGLVDNTNKAGTGYSIMGYASPVK